MSLDAFNKNKDLQIQKNMDSVINSTQKDNSKDKHLSLDQLKKISPIKSEKKNSYTFSITESQLNKMENEAHARGFRNKSEFLAAFIDAL